MKCRVFISLLRCTRWLWFLSWWIKFHCTIILMKPVFVTKTIWQHLDLHSQGQTHSFQWDCLLLISSSTNLANFLPFVYRQLTEEILADDSTTTKCYSPLAKTQVRKQKKESTSYRYAKRESWSSTDNSMEVPRRQRGHSGVSKSPHSSTEMLNLTDVRTPLQMNTSARPSFLRTRATIPNMSMKTREMAGGQADYVWILPGWLASFRRNYFGFPGSFSGLSGKDNEDCMRRKAQRDKRRTVSGAEKSWKLRLTTLFF